MLDKMLLETGQQGKVKLQEEGVNFEQCWYSTSMYKEDMKGQPEDVKTYYQLLECLMIEDVILYMTKNLNKIEDGETHRTCIPESVRATGHTST